MILNSYWYNKYMYMYMEFAAFIKTCIGSHIEKIFIYLKALDSKNQ